MGVPSDFSLDEARSVLSAIQSFAPDGLSAPFSDADCVTFSKRVSRSETVRKGWSTSRVIDGIPAYWCWLAGEHELAWWHPRDGGFAARKPIG